MKGSHSHAQKLYIHDEQGDDNILDSVKVSDWIWDMRAIIRNLEEESFKSFDILVVVGLANNMVHVMSFQSIIIKGQLFLQSPCMI
jgi:hypothetical protein